MGEAKMQGVVLLNFQLDKFGNALPILQLTCKRGIFQISASLIQKYTFRFVTELLNKQNLDGVSSEKYILN